MSTLRTLVSFYEPLLELDNNLIMKQFIPATIFTVLILFCTALPDRVQAADIFFSAPASVSVGDTFSVDVLVDSPDHAFNAAEARILFPTDLLEVADVDASPSVTIFNFWLYLPLFSNEDGDVSFSGGTVRGVLGSDIQLLRISFRAKGSGEALITASDASVNASNGNGTNILENINASRIAVLTAPINIPERTVVPVPSPTPEPTPAPVVTEPTETPATVEEEPDVIIDTPTEEDTAMTNDHAHEHENWETLLEEGCSDIFSTCSLRFPTITDVSVVPHELIGADIIVSGMAPEGDHVHILMTQNDIPYKEVTALIEDGRVWEARIANVTAYGNYKLVTWVEDEGNVFRSELFTWPNVWVYPPYTLNVFGYALRWCVALSIIFATLAVISGVVLVWHYMLKNSKSLFKYTVTAFVVLAGASISVSSLSYYLWQNEHTASQRYWKDTTVPCLSHSHGGVDDHGSAQLSILIDDMPQLIPADIGISTECVADIHTHDNTGRLHLHLHDNAKRATLADFFAVAGEGLEREGYTLLVTINGEDYTDRVRSYELDDGDQIVVSFTSITTQETTAEEQ